MFDRSEAERALRRPEVLGSGLGILRLQDLRLAGLGEGEVLPETSGSPRKMGWMDLILYKAAFT